MDDIFDMLMQEIEQGAFPYFFAQGEYRRSQQSVLEHYQWLEEHLGDEEKAHLEQARAADVSMDTLEREAMTRVALAVGIRLTLPS